MLDKNHTARAACKQEAWHFELKSNIPGSKDPDAMGRIMSGGQNPSAAAWVLVNRMKSASFSKAWRIFNLAILHVVEFTDYDALIYVS